MVADFSGEIGRCLIENRAFPLLTSDQAWDNFPLARQRNVHCPSFPIECSWVPPKHLIGSGDGSLVICPEGAIIFRQGRHVCVDPGSDVCRTSPPLPGATTTTAPDSSL